MNKKLFFNVKILPLAAMLIVAMLAQGATAESVVSGTVIPAEGLNERTLSLAAYTELHAAEWIISPTERTSGTCSDAIATCKINGEEYVVEQYSLERKNIVEPINGFLYEVDRGELSKYVVQDAIRIRIANDGKNIRYCVQHLINPDDSSDTIMVVTFPLGRTGSDKYSVAGINEMDFSTISYAASNGLDTSVAYLCNQNVLCTDYRKYFRYHLNETVSVVYRL